MAEFVNQSIEDMLPELEQMERIRLFTKDETRRILKKRQRLEYRLRKKTKMEEDYLNYIEYETNLLTLIKKRRQSTGYNFKKLEIDIPIVHRIHRLFQLCETRFPNSVDVWLQHIEFSKKRKEFERVSRTFTTLLRILNKIPELWVKAAQWEMEQSSLDVARELMQRGISFNSTSQFLWVEYYKMELQITDMLRKGSQLTQLSQEEDPTLNGTIAMIVLKNAFQQFPDDLDMLLSCIKVSQNYDFARSQLDQMLLDLRSRFSHVSRMWDQLARRFLPVKNGKIAQNVTKEDEEHCYTVFQQAVTEAPSMETWSFYLKTCLELISLPSAVSRKEQRVSNILEVFSAAEKQRLLSVEMFQEWARVLTETLQVTEAERVVQMGLKLYPKSTPLWRKLLVLHFQTLRSPDDVVICLMRALDSVPEKESWDLWQPTLEYLVEQKYDNFQSLLQKATMRPCRDVCQPAKVYHLHWAFLSSSIKAARDVYKELSRIKPVPLQFYLDYVNMELSQSVVNMKRVRRAMEEAILDHGHSEPELWLRFIKIEMSDGNSGLVGDLHFRATSSLDGAYLDYFIQNYPSVCCASNV